MLVLPYLDYTPQIGTNLSADDWVTVIGRTEIGAGCYFGQLATLRGDGEHIRIGSECWFGNARPWCAMAPTAPAALAWSTPAPSATIACWENMRW